MTGSGWEKNVYCEVTTTKNVHLWELPFISVTLIITPVWYSAPSHASFLKNFQWNTRVRMADRNTFLPSLFCFPVWPWTQAGPVQGNEKKKERGKQKTQWLTSTGKVRHCGIRAAWALPFPAQLLGGERVRWWHWLHSWSFHISTALQFHLSFRKDVCWLPW